jgi:thioredoxin reductase
MLDLLIIGSGPAGLTALMFSTMYGLDVLCLGKEFGGKVAIAPGIKDYPGMPNLEGKDFVVGLKEQLDGIGAKYEQNEVVDIEISQNDDGETQCFKVKTSDDKVYEAKTLILAVGNINKQPQKIMVKLLEELEIDTDRGFIESYLEKTNKSGIFAAGDCILYPESLEQLVTATSTGADAAAQVYEMLKKEKPPILWGKAKIPRM